MHGVKRRLVAAALAAAPLVILTGCGASTTESTRESPAATPATTSSPAQAPTPTPTPSTTPLASADDVLKKAFEFAPYTLVDATGAPVDSIAKATEAHLEYDKSLGDFSTHYCFNLDTAQGKFTLTQQYNSAWADYDGKPAGRIYSITPGLCH